MKTIDELCREAAEKTLSVSLKACVDHDIVREVFRQRAATMLSVIAPAFAERDKEIERLSGYNAELRSLLEGALEALEYCGDAEEIEEDNGLLSRIREVLAQADGPEAQQ